MLVALSVACVLLVVILARVLVVFYRDRELAFQNAHLLEDAFRRAGWAEQFKAARAAAHAVRTGHGTWDDWQATARQFE